MTAVPLENKSVPFFVVPFFVSRARSSSFSKQVREVFPHAGCKPTVFACSLAHLRDLLAPHRFGPGDIPV